MKKTLPLALLIGLAVAGCNGNTQKAGQQPVVGEPMAWVNGEPITKESFQFQLERVTQGQPQLANDQHRQMLLNELIEVQLLAQEARRQGLDKDPAIAGRLDFLRNTVLAQANVEQVGENLATDEAALKAEYEERYGEGKLQEYRARHILVADEGQANELVAQLQGGADFAELAKEHSTDVGSGANGGDLGWFQAEQMVPPFAEAVKQLKPGTTSQEPVQSQFGWHVIELEETRPMTAPSFEEVRGQLLQSMMQERIQGHIGELRQQAEIKYAEGVQPPAQESAE